MKFIILYFLYLLGGKIIFSHIKIRAQVKLRIKIEWYPFVDMALKGVI